MKLKVVEKTVQERPANARHWMAEETGISHTSVQRIWAEHGLKPTSRGTFSNVSASERLDIVKAGVNCQLSFGGPPVAAHRPALHRCETYSSGQNRSFLHHHVSMRSCRSLFWDLDRARALRGLFGGEDPHQSADRADDERDCAVEQ